MNSDLARKMLTSPDAGEVAAAALETLGEKGELTDLQAMLAFVKNSDPRLSGIAIVACGNLIRNKLIERFHELDPQVRQKLGAIMESLGPQIVDEIGKDLWCDDDGRRLRAVQILGLLRKNPTIRDILAKLVKDKDEKIRATAVNLLGKIIGPNDHELIMSLLSDKDKRVRANTVEALESLGNKRFLPILLRFRKDPANRIRGNVLKALYSLGFSEVSEDIVAMLQNADPFMKASALWVVSRIKICTPKIEDLAGMCYLSDNEMVFTNAKKALLTLNSPRALGFIRYLQSETVEQQQGASPQKRSAAGK
jgi:HEAT repeat protein